LYKGSQQGADQKHGKRLNNHDLYSLPNFMKSKFLSQQFHSFYNRSRDDNNNDKKNRSQTNYAPNHTTTDHHRNPKIQQQQNFRRDRSDIRHLMYTLWQLIRSTFIPAGYCQLITVLCQVALPLLVRQLLIILEENPNENVIEEGGLLYVILLFVCTICNAFGNHRQRQLAIQSGIILRSTIINVLYEHILLLSCRGKVNLSSGEMTNLLATDTQKLYEVTQDGHLVWSLPLSTILVTIALLLVMGPTTLVGMVVLILFLPIVSRVTSLQMRIRKKRIKQTDQRIQMMNAMLQGVGWKKFGMLDCMPYY
jgi:ABC-type multidrug transport system fused ATPase/permease subunit